MTFPPSLDISTSAEDWSDQSRGAAAEVFPGVPLRRGIEHLKRNLRNNQSQGKRGPRKSKAKVSAAGKAKAKPKATAKAKALPRPAPHLKSRSIWAAINVITEIMYMPSQAMMHIALDCFLDWVRLQWGEQLWHDYFVREYVDKCHVDSRAFGRQELFLPHWWSGAGTCRHWDQPGHPASQQAAEQQNSKFKKDVREHAPEGGLTTHQAVVSSIQGCLRTWLRPLKAVDASTLSPISLMAPPGGLQLSAPDRPDAWMLATGRVIRKPCSNKLTYFPPINVTLKKMRSCRRSFPYEQKTIKDAVRLGGRCEPRVELCLTLISVHANTACLRYLCLPVGAPRKVPPGTLARMLALLRTFNIDKLKEIFLREGFLTQEGELLKLLGISSFPSSV